MCKGDEEKQREEGGWGGGGRKQQGWAREEGFGDGELCNGGNLVNGYRRGSGRLHRGKERREQRVDEGGVQSSEYARGKTKALGRRLKMGKQQEN